VATHSFTERTGPGSGGYDAYLYYYKCLEGEDVLADIYAEVRDKTEANIAPAEPWLGTVGQVNSASDCVTVGRSFLFFKQPYNLSGTTIESASITFRITTLRTDYGNFNLIIQKANSTAIHHQPCIRADYNRANIVATSGGSKNTSEMASSSWVTINFNAAGIEWIGKNIDDELKVVLRSSDDIGGIIPTDEGGDAGNTITLYLGASGYSPPNLPYFTIAFTVTLPSATTQAATDIDTTIATLNGTITDIGHWILSYGFELKEGLEGEVYSTTVGGSTQDITTFNKIVYGLTPGTTYYVRAWGYNEAGKGHGDWVKFTTESAISVTTESAEVPVPTANPAYCEWATGNGTITSGTNATERGFEIKLSFSGDLYDRIQHGMAGFTGDTSLNITVWEGTLTKIETEEGSFAEGAYDMELGSFPAFFDKLFAGESYTYRAYAIIDGVKYHGDYVAFSLGVYSGDDALGDDVVGPAESIIEPVLPEVPEWEWPEIVFPPWEWPEFNIPPWKWPFYDIPPFDFDPSIVFGTRFGAFLRRLDTKKDWETLREKCIIYQENMNQFTLTVNHNTLVMKNLVNDIITYVDGDVYPSDLKLMNSSQQLTPLYNEGISPDGFKDIINDFRFKDVSNTFNLTMNFKKILNSLNSLDESDYMTEPMSYNTKEYIDIQPTAKRMISQLEDMRKKSGEVQKLVVKNFKRIFSYI